jgi:hypothetical protein
VLTSAGSTVALATLALAALALAAILKRGVCRPKFLNGKLALSPFTLAALGNPAFADSPLTKLLALIGHSHTSL